MPTDCPPDGAAVCGCDGIFYASLCDANAVGTNANPEGNCPCSDNAQCGDGKFCAKADGDCDGVGECQPTPTDCPVGGDRLCGCDGTYYASLCEANATGASLDPGGNCPVALRGDTNSDWMMDISDAVFEMLYLYDHGPAPDCPATLDANNNGEADISDVMLILFTLFVEGFEVADPGLFSCDL